MTDAAPSADHAAPTLRLRGVGRRFGGLLAVRDVDLDVPQGERRAVLGPNGAGKTTLFNLICGDIPPSSGTIELYGEDITAEACPGAREARARPHVPAVAALSRADGRGQHLPLDRRRRGWPSPARGPPAARQRRCGSGRGRPRAGSRSTTSCGVRVGDLSHGEHRQVAIAMALAARAARADARRACLGALPRRARPPHASCSSSSIRRSP